MIKYYLHDYGTYIVPQYASPQELETIMSVARQFAYGDMEKSQKDHAIYGVRRYDQETGNIESVDVYIPAVVLDDKEFDRRTKAQRGKSPGCYILAVHAMGKGGKPYE